MFRLIRRLNVVGLYFRPPEIKTALIEMEGKTLSCEIVAEPDNKHDDSALKVIIDDSRKMFIGYIPKEVNRLVRTGIESGILSPSGTVEIERVPKKIYLNLFKREEN